MLRAINIILEISYLLMLSAYRNGESLFQKYSAAFLSCPNKLVLVLPKQTKIDSSLLSAYVVQVHMYPNVIHVPVVFVLHLYCACVYR